MVSSISFHPFISHFPPALFVAGLLLLFLGKKRNDPKLNSAASFNLSLGLLAAVVASFSGMMSVDINLRTTVDVEGHQGYSFLFTILYGFAVWFLWIEAAPIALFLINFFTSGLDETNALRLHLIDSIPYFRFLMMGVGLLLIMRYRPKGILPEKIKHV